MPQKYDSVINVTVSNAFCVYIYQSSKSIAAHIVSGKLPLRSYLL